MNPKSKKFISWFLAFSLMMLSVNLYAKERRGAKLIVTKKDGLQIEGELITVKPNSLLLLNTEGKDESVDIADIKVITIVKKSKLLLGASIGLLIGGGAGALIGKAGGDDPPDDFGIFSFSAEQKALIGGASLGALGLILGGIAGLTSGTDKTILLEGMSDSEIEKALEKLRKKARIRDYR